MSLAELREFSQVREFIKEIEEKRNDYIKICCEEKDYAISLSAQGAIEALGWVLDEALNEVEDEDE
jgi:hypothetical protein